MSSQKSLWQVYVDYYLMHKFQGKGLSSAAIVGLNGRIWARSNNFPAVTAKEVQDIRALLENTSSNNPPNTSSNNPSDNRHLVLGAKSYDVSDTKPNDSIKAAKPGEGGVTIKKINQALIIGIYGNSVTADDDCVGFVEFLGDYLLQQGY